MPVVSAVAMLRIIYLLVIHGGTFVVVYIWEEVYIVTC